jgi:hypothetical protein
MSLGLVDVELDHDSLVDQEVNQIKLEFRFAWFLPQTAQPSSAGAVTARHTD